MDAEYISLAAYDTTPPGPISKNRSLHKDDDVEIKG